MFRVLSPIIVLLAMFAASAFVETAQAQSSDLFMVRDVPLDSRANTAQAARVKALADGQQMALEILLKRLTLSRDWIALPQPDTNAVNGMVSSIQINNEKISAGSYQADLTVEFEPSGIRNLLRRSGIAFSEARYKPVLILPVYASGGLVSYNYGTNPVRDAWEKIARNPGLIPYRVAGDNNVSPVYFPADRALDLDAQTVDQMKTTTNSEAVIAVRVDALAGSDTSPRLKLTIRDYSETLGAEGTNSEFLYAENGETLDDLIARSARMASIALEDHWKSQTLARFDERSDLLVEVPLHSLVQWRDLLAHLNTNILIAHVDIRSLASNRAQLLVHILGPVSQIRLSLAQDDLTLEQVNDSTSPASDTQHSSGTQQHWQLTSGAQPGG